MKCIPAAQLAFCASIAASIPADAGETQKTVRFAKGKSSATIVESIKGDTSIAGLNTVSNMMFSLFQFSTAIDIGLASADAALVVTLQTVGGGAGNMICVHNVVAASAIVGLVNREGDLIRMALIADGMNLWWIAAIVWSAARLLAMCNSKSGKPGVAVSAAH
jgi:hypothetical protein